MRAVFDIEANGFLETVTKVWCTVIKDIDTGKIYSLQHTDSGPVGLSLLDKCHVLIGHNIIGYDLPVLKKVFGWEPAPETVIVDTWILSQILDPDRAKHPRCSPKKGPHSLENFGCIFNRYKPEHEDWTQFSPEMLHRCTEDVEINHLTWMMLDRKAKLFDPNSTWRLAYEIDHKFFKEITKQVDTGILVDQERAKALLYSLHTRAEQIDQIVLPQLPLILNIEETLTEEGYTYVKAPFTGKGKLHANTVKWAERVGVTPTSICGPYSRVSFEQINLASGEQIKTLLLDWGWIPQAWNTKEDPVTGAVTRTSPKINQEETFDGVEGEIGKLVAERFILKHRESQLVGILERVRPDGRISARVTGFTPTSRCRHADVVNLPGVTVPFGKEFRHIFVSKPGYLFVGCDATSCQLRNLCHHMGDDEFTFAVINGKQEDGTDPHTINMKKAGLPNRTAAKRFIYGFLFGAGNAKIGAIIGKGADEGKKIKDTYLSNLPLLKRLIDNLKSQFKYAKKIIGLDGREIYPRSGHEVLCYQLQSDEAIIMKVATLYVNNWIRAEWLDAKMVAHMHDEFLFEVREDHAPRVAELAAKAIKDAGRFLKLKVPMQGDAKIGKSWYEVH